MSAFHGAKPVPATRIEPAPVYSALNSFALLNAVDRLPGLGRWVRLTEAELAPRQLRSNRILFEELAAAVLLDDDWPDFPAYLEALAAAEPRALSDRVLHTRQPDDQQLSPAAAALLADPPALQDVAVSHLRTLWDAYAAREWASNRRIVEQQVAMLSRPTADIGVAPAAIVRNLATFVASEAGPSTGVDELVYVPSLHTGRHVTRLTVGSRRYLFFDAELYSGVVMRDYPIKQVELIGRLSALSEPARLRVLTLLAQHEELSLQELMYRLDTSQPNVSRYLKSLGSFVRERRGKDGRKRYRLAPAEFDVMFRALKQAVLGEPAPDSNQEQPMQTGLTRYLDAHGAVFVWPRLEDERQLVLEYVADRFAPDRTYSEREVNAVLMHYVLPHVRDHLNVRRDLIDYRLLERSSDGKQYWRSKSAAQPPRVLSEHEAYDLCWGDDRPDTKT